MLQTITYKADPGNRKPNIQGLSRHFEKVCLFDSNKNSNDNTHTQHAKLLAIGATQELIIKKEGNALNEFQSFYDQQKGWLFGYLSYDLKNEMENLSSENADGIEFPVLCFFSPQVVIEIENEVHHIHYDTDHLDKEGAEKIYSLAFSDKKTIASVPKTNIQHRITKEEYIGGFNKLKQHILRGDIYEVNFCQEFYSENAIIDPAATFEKLNSISEAPFSAFCKFDGHYLLSSSPERFLRKQGKMLISQPIKGTIRRSADKAEDEKLKSDLRNNKKEQNENVMIVDLVRNDLSRIAAKGSVKVDELFGVYSFKQVHQLISTVSCELKDNASFTDILKATFPMGSMTGAPKVSAMKLIEQCEQTKRGLYSGALGYIDPEGNFDFSVVIRSILYNSSNNYLSFMTGSAITAKAEAEQEYEECLLKAKAMFEVLK